MAAPNQPLHLTAARLRFGINTKGLGWAAAGDRQRYRGFVSKIFIVAAI
jgi:hypothetical protein